MHPAAKALTWFFVTYVACGVAAAAFSFLSDQPVMGTFLLFAVFFGVVTLLVIMKASDRGGSGEYRPSRRDRLVLLFAFAIFGGFLSVASFMASPTDETVTAVLRFSGVFFALLSLVPLVVGIRLLRRSAHDLHQR